MGTQEDTTEITGKLTDSALLKLYLNIQDNSTTDVLHHKRPVAPLPSKATVESSPTDAQTVTALPIIDTSKDTTNANSDVLIPDVKVRNTPTNQDNYSDLMDSNNNSSEESLIELQANPSSLKA